MNEVRCPNCLLGPFGWEMTYCPSCGEVLPSGGLLHDRYKLLRLIGEGGGGSVYLASDTVVHDRQCAVKRIDFKSRNINIERAAKEARMVVKALDAGLVGIPDVYDIFAENKALFLVMRYIKGQSLEKWADETQRPWQETVEKVLQAAQIVQQLHTLTPPIAHADIKPRNILLDSSNLVWLVDFGLSRIDQEIDYSDTSYIPGFTRDYAPWEQIQQERPSRATDIYALGMTLYRLLVGRDIFEKRKSANAFLDGKPFAGLISDDFFNPEWPPQIRQVLLSATCEDPQKRLSLPEFVAILYEALRAEQVRPLILNDTVKIRTSQDFVDLAERNPNYALRLLQNSAFTSWLRKEHYQDDLANRLEKIMHSAPDAYQGLETILHILRPDLPIPQLEYSISERQVIIAQARQYRLFLQVSNITRGYLPVEIVTKQKWLNPSQTKFGILGHERKEIDLLVSPHLIDEKKSVAQIELRTPQKTETISFQVVFTTPQWLWMKYLRLFFDVVRPLAGFLFAFFFSLSISIYPFFQFILMGIQHFGKNPPGFFAFFLYHVIGFMTFKILSSTGAEFGYRLGIFDFEEGDFSLNVWRIFNTVLQQIRKVILPGILVWVILGGIWLSVFLLSAERWYMPLNIGLILFSAFREVRRVSRFYVIKKNIYEHPLRKSATFLLFVTLLMSFSSTIYSNTPLWQYVPVLNNFVTKSIPAPHGEGPLYSSVNPDADEICYIESMDEIEIIDHLPLKNASMIKVKARCSAQWQEGWVKPVVLQPLPPKKP